MFPPPLLVIKSGKYITATKTISQALGRLSDRAPREVCPPNRRPQLGELLGGTMRDSNALPQL